MRSRSLVAAILCTFLAIGSHAATEQRASDRGDVESAVQRFANLVSRFDFAGIRAVTTDDFEIIENGLRLDLDGFVDLFGRMKARATEPDFGASRFKTDVVGEVGYSSFHMLNASSGSEFFEAAVLQRVDRVWLIDRYFTVRVPADGQ